MQNIDNATTQIRLKLNILFICCEFKLIANIVIDIITKTKYKD